MAVKASNFRKDQQLSTNDSQRLQYQSDKNIEFQQVPIWAGIWFGTRGSEVQIVSLDQPFQADPVRTGDVIGCMRYLSNTPFHRPTLVIDQNATASNIRATVAAASNKSGSDGVVVFSSSQDMALTIIG